MRTLGLDLGTKTIGLAVSDELGITAQGLPTLERRGPRKDLEALALRVTELSIAQFVIGLPLNMDGSEGPRATATREFGNSLTQHTSLPVIYWDERLTTVAAHRALSEGDVSAAKRKKLVDQLAAVFILQGWMDAQKSVIRDEDPD